MTTLDVGQDIDRYSIEGVLGRGGMAVVYRVRHRDLDSLHALKVLTMMSPSVRDRLRLEGRAQAKLRHPNIVSVTDLVDVDGAPGLVMELVEGPSLEERLQNGEMDLATADAIARGMLAGVVEAHRHGLVHRDLKPGNVLLASQGGALVPKITDFGLVKVVMADSVPGRNATRAGSTMGTPAYMAPEQIRDAGGVDARADLFSLGVILYELVCGQSPFVGGDMLEMFNRICSGDYRPPTEHNPLLPPRMVTAIQAALVVDRDARVPDCRTLLDLWVGADAGTHGTPGLPPSRPPEADTRSLTPAVQSMETYYQEEDSGEPFPTIVPENNDSETIYEESAARPPVPEPAPEPTVDAPAKAPHPGRVVGLAAVAGVLLLGALWVGFGGTTEQQTNSSLSTWTPVAPKKAESEPVAVQPPVDEPAEVPEAPAAVPAPARPAPKPATPPPQDKPAPESAPKVEPKPEPPPEAAPKTGHVAVQGIERAWLVNSAGRFPPGDVPPGTYSVKAFFDGTEAVPAGQITVVAGGRHVLKCSATLTVCTAQ